jgi:pimeloyl-ACP methyl ester carboxylesterase
MTDALTLRHNRMALALHRLRDADPAAQGAAAGDGARDRDTPGGARPLLYLHGLGDRSPEAVPERLVTWPGPIWALDFTGHGRSTVPVGGGYSCELLMADADAALAALGPSTVYGRGLGGYVALLIAGARPDLVRGAVIDDGPGLTGGGTEPGTPFVLTQPFRVGATPDPYALLELSHDVRPPDYATTLARQAATLSGLDVAVVVAAVVRPAWLAAVAQEPGVQSLPVPEALRLFAR